MAIKRIPDTLASPEQAKRVLREVAILRRLQHVNVIGLRDAFTRPSATGLPPATKGVMLRSGPMLEVSMRAILILERYYRAHTLDLGLGCDIRLDWRLSSSGHWHRRLDKHLLRDMVWSCLYVATGGVSRRVYPPMLHEEPRCIGHNGVPAGCRGVSLPSVLTKPPRKVLRIHRPAFAGRSHFIGGELVPSSIDTYLVMEYADGGDLFHLKGQLGAREVCDLMRQLLEALTYLHTQVCSPAFDMVIGNTDMVAV